jgi:hypothetical protein
MGFGMRGGRGPGGAPGGGGAPPAAGLFRLGELLGRELGEGLPLNEEQRREVARLEEEVDRKLGEVLSEEQRAQLRSARGGGPGAAPRGPGLELDPLVGLDDQRKPLRSRLLAVPSLRSRYLENVRTIAREWLEGDKLAALVDQHRALLEKEIEADTRKLEPYAAFQRAVGEGDPQAGPSGRGGGMNLRAFARERSRYLLQK